jgi:hypothetical protein
MERARLGQSVDWRTATYSQRDVDLILENYLLFHYETIIDRLVHEDSTIHPLTASNVDPDYIYKHERVRPLHTVAALCARTSGCKHMYGLFHAGLPKRPLMFCSVCTQSGNDLTHFHQRIDLDMPEGVHDTAVFYSVNSPWGLGRAGWFLTQVKGRYLEGFANVITFSPIPCLREMAKEFKGEQEMDEKRVRRHLETDCPVYKFHIENGARLDQLIRYGDGSDLGKRLSYGWQASYRYK